MNDSDLLQRFSQSGCEAAFTEVVKRNVDLVFSAALRQVGGDRHLAEDVTQTVFNDLAHKAASLSHHVVLSGWLYTSTRYVAAKRVRTEQRRRAREEESFHMQETDSGPANNPDWERLQPILDDAMHELKDLERNAVLLRFFEKRNFSEVGAKLGLSEDAARMRVDRALERLRKLLGQRGVTSTTASLALILTQQALSAAPAGLAASVAGTALASAAAGTGTTLTFLELISMTKAKAAAIAALITGVTVPLVIQNNTNEGLLQKHQALAKQYDDVLNQLAPLQAENKRLVHLLAQPSPSDERSNELFGLRAEVTRLRQGAREAARLKAVTSPEPNEDPLNATLRTLGVRASNLKQRLDHMPDKTIPELQFLNEKDWLDAVANLPSLETDEDYRQALNNLRARAKATLGSKLQKAVQKFADANTGMLPSDLSQLQNLFEEPIDPAILQRYKMAQGGNINDLARSDTIIEEIAPAVDDEYDTHFKFHLQGTSSTSYSQVGKTLEDAALAYAQANNGLLPKTPAHLAAYLQQSIDPARVQKFLAKIPANVTTLDQYQDR